MGKIKSFILSALLILAGFQVFSQNHNKNKVRGLADVVGYASEKYQTDSVVNRIERTYGTSIARHHRKAGITKETQWKVAICPHDDYAYAGQVYQSVLPNVQSPVVFVFGVAHKARQLGIQDKIVFDSYKYWHGPYRRIKVSPVRDEILKLLPNQNYIISDTLQQVEHSVEAVLPFLQHQNRKIRIVSILVPAMTLTQMQQSADTLAGIIASIAHKHKWEWGKDYSFVISSDAVHYGDQGWGDNNYASYGVDTAGYRKAVEHEMKIMQSITGNLSDILVKNFSGYTVDDNDYTKYKWTWCGRYSIPYGLYVAIRLQNKLGLPALRGKILGYATSHDHKPLPVSDLKMGVTTPQSLRHWVGYPALGFK